jgi:UDP-N-acetyl-D-galactosamine dehydrogenase
MQNKVDKISVIGLGYVGLPLAVAFSSKYQVLGFDINEKRINELNSGFDATLEIENSQLKDVLRKGDYSSSEVNGLWISKNEYDLNSSNVFIITVPTPIDKHNRPVLTPMIKASQTVSKYLKKGDIVIYESTVYPGVTEEEMVPILESCSGLKYNLDFYCGYSPERINPGDKEHTVTNILKVTSGSTPGIAEKVDQLYKSIIVAGTFKASSIMVAEAAKVIENSQRDINIAFVNELSKIFSALNIDTYEVLEAASTKWNFLKFKPGLVGGHCIGVDPYYLAQKSQEVGYHPEIILAGRRLNDSMGKYIAKEVVKLMLKKDLKVLGSKVLLLGFTFKEDCPDVRNTKVIDIYNELISYEIEIDVYDPWANSKEVFEEYSIQMKSNKVLKDLNSYSAIILAVAHKEFVELDLAKSGTQVIFDVKGILPTHLIDKRL